MLWDLRLSVNCVAVDIIPEEGLDLFEPRFCAFQLLLVHLRPGVHEIERQLTTVQRRLRDVGRALY